MGAASEVETAELSRASMPEADDTFYERLIIDRLAPSYPLKWYRNKVSASLFARHFGLTDKDIEDIPNLSKKKLAAMIEEGIAS